MSENTPEQPEGATDSAKEQSSAAARTTRASTPKPVEESEITAPKARAARTAPPVKETATPIPPVEEPRGYIAPGYASPASARLVEPSGVDAHAPRGHIAPNIETTNEPRGYVAPNVPTTLAPTSPVAISEQQPQASTSNTPPLVIPAEATTASHQFATEPVSAVPVQSYQQIQAPRYSSGQLVSGTNQAAYPTRNPTPKYRKRFGAGTVVTAAVLAALIGGGAAVGGNFLFNNINKSSNTQGGAPQSIVVNNPETVTGVNAVALKASPSVVTINVSGSSTGGTGSGVVLTEDGYVLTNTHVVTLDGSTGAATIKVKTSDGRLYDATVIGTDPLSDLAVIKLKNAGGLVPISFADSDKVNVGDLAVAIGAPLTLSGTVTKGIVSTIGRSISVDSSAAPSSPDDSQTTPGTGGNSDEYNFSLPNQHAAKSKIFLPVIQTDASINPGNSGGPLLNGEGKVIGINTAIYSTKSGSDGTSGSIGVGFAVTSNLAARIAKELIKDGKATHGLLGASVSSAESDAKSEVVGALVQSVSPGGAAEAAGLKAGDVIVRVNDSHITSQADLTAQIRALAGGATAKITYIRGTNTNTIDVTVGSYTGQ